MNIENIVNGLQLGLKDRHLQIYFDVNKTVIATDSAGGKGDVDLVIQELLAERTQFRWTDQLDSPISYSEYLNKHLYPGDKYDPKIRALRHRALCHFVKEWQDQLPELEDEFEKISTKVKQQTLFPSFLFCIKVLKEAQVNFSLILRTFGDDLNDVVSHIQEQFPHTEFVRGVIQKGSLQIADINHLDPLKWSEFLKKHQWVAIKDDWSYWKDLDCKEEGGKPFPVISKDFFTHSLFFDDNIEEPTASRKNIIAPIGMSFNDLWKKKQLIKVDTVEAIFNDFYFLNEILESVKLSTENRS